VEPTKIDRNPCDPSPCGPNSNCRQLNNRASCTCIPGMLGAPPACRPECVIHQDCPSDRACVNKKCQDPCVGSCGFNALCKVQKHQPICSCFDGYEGDPYGGCNVRQGEFLNPFYFPSTPFQDFSISTIACPKIFIATPIETYRPCVPFPCGANAICREQNGAGSCTCMQNYYGDPYIGCRPECIQNSDCSPSKACVNTKCVDPCAGSCGLNSECKVLSHSPVCYCLSGYTGNPAFRCEEIPPPSKCLDYDFRKEPPI